MNKQFVEQMKAQRALVKRNIEEIYSAMCVVLYERGYDIDEIGLIVEAVQLKWEEVAQTEGANMCDLCVELTGIEIREER